MNDEEVKEIMDIATLILRKTADHKARELADTVLGWLNFQKAVVTKAVKVRDESTDHDDQAFAGAVLQLINPDWSVHPASDPRNDEPSQPEEHKPGLPHEDFTRVLPLLNDGLHHGAIGQRLGFSQAYVARIASIYKHVLPEIVQDWIAKKGPLTFAELMQLGTQRSNLQSAAYFALLDEKQKKKRSKKRTHLR